MSLLNKAIQDSKDNTGKQVAILFIDLDRFKNINDALGHTFGDKVLKQMSQRFASIQKRGDTLARLGGDEFILMVNDVMSMEEISGMAEKIQREAKTPVKLEGHEIFY